MTKRKSTFRAKVLRRRLVRKRQILFYRFKYSERIYIFGWRSIKPRSTEDLRACQIRYLCQIRYKFDIYSAHAFNLHGFYADGRFLSCSYIQKALFSKYANFWPQYMRTMQFHHILCKDLLIINLFTNSLKNDQILSLY